MATATVKYDEQNAGLMALSAANCLARIGGVDATVNDNATITLLAAAIRALPAVAGSAPDLNEKVAQGLELGVLANVVLETHAATTLATLISTIAANVPNAPSTFDAFLPQ